jgi:glycosyltransferase involved in cell wall biosynthesis
MTSSQERSLFLAFFPVFPPSGGASQVSFQLARHWPGERKIVQVGGVSNIQEIEAGLSIETLSYEGGGERWRKLSAVPRWRQRMGEITREFVPDTIFLEGASWCAYHWSLISLLRKSAPHARIVYHAHNVEYDLRRQKHSWFIAWLTRQVEGRLLKAVDVATAVSQVDADRFVQLYQQYPNLLPNGVDLDWVRDVDVSKLDAIRQQYGLSSKTVLFMGAYGYRPNGEAIDFLITEVFPALKRREPKAQLLVLGGETPYSEDWLVAPGVVPVDDLSVFIRAATVSVAPIFSGSGTRLKVIESLAANIPVIATEKGVEGLEITPGVEYFRAENAADFVDAIVELFESKANQNHNEIEDFLKKMSWPQIVSNLRLDFIKEKI